MKVWYRLKCIRKSLGVTGAFIEADTLDHALERIKEKHNIKLVIEYYSEGSLYAGLEWRRYWAIEGSKVVIELVIP